jgi:hypothetical protein
MFLISSLVGVALGNVFADQVPDLIERPDAPNLYWALTALPRPLISTRKGEELEYRLLELQFPDMADLQRERTPEQWDAVLRRVRTGYKGLSELEEKPSPPFTAPSDPASKSPDLAAARKYLTEQRRLPAARVKAMPDAQVLLLAIAGNFEDYRDEMFKATYLPYLEARQVLAAAHKRLKALPRTELTRLPRMLLPALDKVLAAQNRLDRRIAILRVIEALRMHAAANDGQLPEKLSDVKVVPVPNDPGTGRPFEYRREGRGATLTGRIPGEPLDKNGLRYRITLRKK